MRYHEGVAPQDFVSLTMLVRPAPYLWDEPLHPIFQMNLPEGYVLERLRQRLAKATAIDPMLLLALTGRDAAIGRVHVGALPELVEALAPTDQDGRGERLAQILAFSEFWIPKLVSGDNFLPNEFPTPFDRFTTRLGVVTFTGDHLVRTLVNRGWHVRAVR
jgi:HipA-like protein